VSFAHGSNDGQKGMGLIMLILIGSVPTAFALNHAMPSSAMPAFYQATERAQAVFAAHAAGATLPSVDAARTTVTDAVQARRIDGPQVWAALDTLAGDIAAQVRGHGEMNAIPAAAVPNVRNDMYLVSEAIRIAQKSGVPAEDAGALASYRGAVDSATKFIPIWVKVAVAIALGLGTMIGWKRIVVTVGEKIGKSHLTYGQGRRPSWWRRPRSVRPIRSACRSRPRMCCPAAWRAPCWPTARGCNGARCAASRWPGC
jgi:PiT family inorganic phosphate transporter